MTDQESEPIVVTEKMSNELQPAPQPAPELPVTEKIVFMLKGLEPNITENFVYNGEWFELVHIIGECIFYSGYGVTFQSSVAHTTDPLRITPVTRVDPAPVFAATDGDVWTLVYAEVIRRPLQSMINYLRNLPV